MILIKRRRLELKTRLRLLTELILFALILSACASTRSTGRLPTPTGAVKGGATDAVPPLSTGSVPLTPAPAPRPDGVSWQVQELTWEPGADVYSPLAKNPLGGLSLLFIDRLRNRLDLAVLSADGWAYSSMGKKTEKAMFPSLAFDPAGGAHAAFYQPEDSSILYGSQVEDGWQVETAVENTNTVALTLVFNPEGQPLIVFSDLDLEQIRLAKKTAQGWEVSDIAAARVVDTVLPALYGLDGRLHVVYNAREQGLVYLTLQDDGTWQPQVAAAGGGRFPALAFGADGTAYISYSDPVEKQLRVAVSGPDGWRIQTADSSPGTGKYASIAVDAGQNIHISYYDETRGSLKYALGSAGGWNNWTVDEQREVGWNSSLALDASGNPRVVYFDHKGRSLRFVSVRLSEPDPGHAKVRAEHRHGQTFVIWDERSDLHGEIYRVYRSAAPAADMAGLSEARLLAQVGEGSARFYQNYHDEGNHKTWRPRYTENYIAADGAMPLPDQVGLLVWTLAGDDLQGEESGSGYYAVTVTPQGGKETLLPGYQAGPVEERVADPRPVEISGTFGINADPRRHVYIQYMDLRRWNATFHAPNRTNSFYGFPADTAGIAQSLQYAYDYTVFEPSEEDCEGKVPEVLPVNLFLHGYRGNRYGETTQNPFPYCAYTILPIDQTETWYFGFAQKHDFRQEGEIEAGDTIENYTEQRVLRMVYDLLQNPPGPAADAQRVYVFGHSMGGSGALAFAERYPNVFAGAYSGQPITNYATAGETDRDWAEDVALKWGKPELNLPVAISAPGGWAEPLARYNGIGVWDWQNTLAGVTRHAGEDTVPLGVDHGVPDDVIIWQTQGEPLYPALANAGQAWGGLVNDAGHEWSDFAGQLPSMGGSGDVLPFWNFSMVRDETVPGISQARPNPLEGEDKGLYYNHAVLWSSSWNPWDGSPVDEPERWQISLCAGKPGSEKCEAGQQVTADITPRRLQRFTISPGQAYRWQMIEIASGRVSASGTITAGDNGLITVPGVLIPGSGVRLLVEQAR